MISISKTFGEFFGFFFKCLEMSISIGPFFLKSDWMGAAHSGLHPYFILGSNIFLSSRCSSFWYYIFVRRPELLQTCLKMTGALASTFPGD